MKPFYTNVTMDKSRICYRGIDSIGNRVKTIAPFNPELYVPVLDTEGDMKSLYGKPLKRKVFEDDADSSGVRKAYKYMREQRDIHPDAEIYGQTNYVSQFIRKHNPSEIEFDISKLCIVTLDIETECEDGFPDVRVAKEEITCLTLYDSLSKTFYVFSNDERGKQDPKKYIEYAKHGEKVVIVECVNELEMLSKFMSKWEKDLCFPDVISGWNCVTFDIPYLINRLYRVFHADTAMVDRRLSPWGTIKEKEERDGWGNDNQTYIIEGIATLDYMKLYKEFGNKQESYALSHIAFAEIGEAKLSYEQYDSMHLFYLEDYPAFVEYNLKDVWLINRIDDKLKLMEFAITLAYMAKVNYSEIYSPVRMIESLCNDYLLSKNIIMKAKTYGETEKAAYLGGYVKEPVPGLYDWVVSFDLNSLYPSLIRQMNLSPETLVPELENPAVSIKSLLAKSADLSYAKQHNVSVAANGHHFSHDKLGFVPEIIEKLVSGRRTVKNEMLEAEQNLELVSDPETKSGLEYEIAFKNLKQMALKTLSNSIYGAMGNQYFAFYDTRLASAITHHGQFVIQMIEGEVNRFMNALVKTEGEDYVFYSDTDSIYISFEKVVNGFKERTGETDVTKIIDYMNRVCEERVSPWIDKVYAKMAEETNAYEPHMVMKREVLASRGVWKKKKNYVLYVYDSEGVRFAEPKLKIMGIETQRSSTPQWCRDKLKHSINLIMTQNQESLQDYVASIRPEYDKLSPSDIAFPKPLNDYNKYIIGGRCAKGTPWNVRAAFVHNTMLEEKELKSQYRDLTPGNKMKCIYLKEPNPTKGNAIAFMNSLPQEFEISGYVDYETMFQKSFLKPLQNILDVIGWDSIKRHTLEEYFEWG